MTDQPDPDTASAVLAPLGVERILCPTDFSEPARDAVRVAERLAHTWGAELLLVHVVPTIPAVHGPTPTVDFDVQTYQRNVYHDAQVRLDALIEEDTAAAVRTATAVGQGDAATEVARIAEEKEADAVVISTHGRTGLKRAVLGSVTEKVVRHSEVPVLVIPYTEQG